MDFEDAGVRRGAARIASCAILMAGCLATAPVLRGELRAGVARVDITPPLGKYTLVASGKIATAVRDPLYAKVIVFETGTTRVAIVSLDLVGAFPPELFDEYRRRLKQEAAIDYVVLNASHTHTSLDLENNATELRKWPWMATAMEQVYSAILQAHRDAVPVRLSLGYGESTIGTNRRWVTPEGVKTLGRNSPNKQAVEPSDRRVGVLRVDRQDGSALAAVVHYACHPVALMANDSVAYSADYVGEMEREVAERLPGHPEVLFWQGAAGDINMRNTIEGSGEPEVKQYGHELAEAVVTGWGRASKTITDALSFRSETLTFPSRWSPKAVAAVAKETGNIDRWFGLNYLPQYPAPVGSVLLGKELALALLPGEPFIDFQFRLDAASPIQNTWLLGYCDRVDGYLPTIRAASEGGYGANGPETLLQVGAGEHMVTWALVRIYEQLGLFSPLPDGVPRKKVQAAGK
ncbi:MAG TPA: hypothetical protein VG675_06855 [Bryobacteraceae bacterium]|nr:hypothetical protein [Bryobacteraceae bacterium]